MTEIDDDGLANFHASTSALGMRFGDMSRIVVDPTEDPDTYENRDYLMICEICDVLLNRFTFPEGESWVHARNWQKFDHEPVLKKIAKAEHVPSMCDFCGHEDEPLVWAFETSERIQAQSGNTTHDYGKTWGSCPQCAPFILAQDLDGLIERCARVSPVGTKYGMDKQVLRGSLYQMLGPVMHLLESRRWIGPKREPSRLDPRMLPKVHAGLIKFWSSPLLYDLIPGKNWMRHSVPAVHAGVDEEIFKVTYGPEHTLPPRVWARHTEHIVRNLQSSVFELYWVSKDFTTLAAMAAHDFEHFSIAREDLPSPAGLIVWETPIGVIQRPGGEAGIRAVSWCPIPNGIWINAYIQGEDADPEVDVTQMRADFGYLMCTNAGSGLSWDQSFGDAPGDMAASTLGFILTMFSTFFLLNQPGVAEMSTAPVDKKVERAYKRNRTTMPPVRLVNLRRQPSRSRHESDEAAAERRKFRFRRYTKGHWKRQFYGPKRGLRKMIYISPYISGDANLPLKDKAPVVKVLR